MFNEGDTINFRRYSNQSKVASGKITQVCPHFGIQCYANYPCVHCGNKFISVDFDETSGNLEGFWIDKEISWCGNWS